MTTSETTSFMLRIYKSMRLLELTTTDKYFEETCSITRPSEWQRFGWYMENASHAKIFVVISTFRLIRRLQRCIVCDRWSRWWVGGSQSMAAMGCIRCGVMVRHRRNRVYVHFCITVAIVCTWSFCCLLPSTSLHWGFEEKLRHIKFDISCCHSQPSHCMPRRHKSWFDRVFWIINNAKGEPSTEESIWERYCTSSFGKNSLLYSKSSLP